MSGGSDHADSGAPEGTDDWPPMYAAILEEFGWDGAADRRSAKWLASLVPPKTWNHVGTELKNRARAVVVGCGPQLDALEARDLPDGVVVACDGATARLREIGVLPRIVVTDLDGDPEALRWAGGRGASMVVHAHGDNGDRLDLVDGLGPFVAGTCQCDPAGLEPLRNLQGFTDGDRAVRLCEAMLVRQVDLVAFDFDGEPSRYSGAWDAETKPQKLAWAQRIIVGVHARGRTQVRHWIPA